jgi:chromosome segregation ATPase
MSVIAIGLNLLLAGLLAAALAMGWRLNLRLKALRDSHEGFAKAVADLDAAVARAEQGLADLRAATDEATDTLADRIAKARELSAKLDRQTQAGHRAPVESPARAPLASRTPLRDREPLREREPPREREREPDLDLDVERVTHRLGSLLSAAREPRPRLEPERIVRREAPRQRPSFEEDLFADEAEPAPLRTALGGRR